MLKASEMKYEFCTRHSASTRKCLTERGGLIVAFSPQLAGEGDARGAWHMLGYDRSTRTVATRLGFKEAAAYSAPLTFLRRTKCLPFRAMCKTVSGSVYRPLPGKPSID